MNRHCAARFRSRSSAVDVQFWTASSDFQMAAFVSIDWSMGKRLAAVTLPAPLPVTVTCASGPGRTSEFVKRSRRIPRTAEPGALPPIAL